MEWVNVKDRLPNEGDRCWFCDNHNNVFRETYNENAFDDDTCDECHVTHWKLDEPPESPAKGK